MTLVIIFLLSMVAQKHAVADSGEPLRPNIIIILADDLGYGDLSSYGHPSIDTPALDRLAAEGQRWTDFYANAPVCSPSRGALMTGKLPIRSGLYGIRNGVFWPNAHGGIRADDRTFADILKAAGYRTAMVGKWHLGDKADALPTRHGFEKWIGLPYSNDMDWVGARDFHGVLERAMAGEFQARDTFQKFLESRIDPGRNSSDWNVPLISSQARGDGYVDKIIARPAPQATLTRRYTEEAVSFIRARPVGQPFLLYMAYQLPHLPIFTSKLFTGRSMHGAYGDAVEEIDWSVSEIRRALEDLRIAENTLVVFSSDNGPDGVEGGGTPGLLRGYKGTTFEGGMRVPGIFWWPGRIKPKVVHGIGTLMDLYATVLSVAGVPSVSDTVDSIDLNPALQGQPSPRDSVMYYSGGKLTAYRKSEWKVSFEGGQRTALYNLAHDPSELRDISQVNSTILKALTAEAEAKDAAVPRAAPIFDLD